MTSPFRNPEFESSRLAMRPQSAADAEALFEAYGDAHLMTWWSSGPHTSVAQTVEYLTASDLPSDWRGWTMVDRDSGDVIGTLAAGNVRPGVVEVGYMVIRRFWGRGYARESVTRLLDLLFAEEGHRRVMADVDPDNAASIGLVKRLGFTLEGRLRGEWETHIGVRDSLIWGLLRDEWHGRTA
ncbi:GNAT family N-acetyltransferase [Sphingomonas sp.]|uniref:GNAT family N-acetyltransferase n=1 Tax=Sphingomonas sp. TaxID=28214 RepID=UPI002DD66C52|nr:GNAT family protein [Sphingomonas sp.]